MVIYLRHEIHGTKVACSELEATHDCANGWEIVSENEENITELREKWEEKFGKKPHHMKKADRLRQELSG